MVIGGSKKEVIKNIQQNILDNELNKKVEVNDATLNDEEIAKYLDTFYKNKNKKISYWFKHQSANGIVRKYMKMLDNDITIKGLENIKELDLSNGAIITSNHFNPLDTFIIRKLVEKVLKKDLYIVIQDTNLAMPGMLGFLMNYVNVIPVSKSPTYLAGTFKETLKSVLDTGAIVLIYPEEEMWFNYRKIRPLKRGAYQYAAVLNVPVISCFTKIEDTDIPDNDEFNKTLYELNVLGVLYPDKDVSPRTNSINMLNQDYSWKKTAYEKLYNEKLDYTFNVKDIAGWRK
ncbi:MAG: lysophospholipid acyltransferase family protein [bacterium]|nr:lysophospholipid acyltransferase family protein [bacterium]